MSSESSKRTLRYQTLQWFEGYNCGYAQPQCPARRCLFIAERTEGAWECWKHGRFEVSEYPRGEEPAEDSTEQAGLEGFA